MNTKYKFLTLTALILAGTLPNAFGDKLGEATTAELATPPNFNYFGNGSDKNGLYRIYQYSLTGPEQEGKYPVAWMKVVWDKPLTSKAGPYSIELILLKFDCPHKKYVVAARIRMTADGQEISRTATKRDDFRYLPLSDMHQDLRLLGVSTEEMQAVAEEEQACFPFK